jgi:hypothetical protein
LHSRIEALEAISWANTAQLLRPAYINSILKLNFRSDRTGFPLGANMLWATYGLLYSPYKESIERSWLFCKRLNNACRKATT